MAALRNIALIWLFTLNNVRVALRNNRFKERLYDDRDKGCYLYTDLPITIQKFHTELEVIYLKADRTYVTGLRVRLFP